MIQTNTFICNLSNDEHSIILHHLPPKRTLTFLPTSVVTLTYPPSIVSHWIHRLSTISVHVDETKSTHTKRRQWIIKSTYFITYLGCKRNMKFTRDYIVNTTLFKYKSFIRNIFLTVQLGVSYSPWEVGGRVKNLWLPVDTRYSVYSYWENTYKYSIQNILQFIIILCICTFQEEGRGVLFIIKIRFSFYRVHSFTGTVLLYRSGVGWGWELNSVYLRLSGYWPTISKRVTTKRNWLHRWQLDRDITNCFIYIY